MSNYRTIERNTLDGLSEMAGILYLRLLDVFQGHTPEGERKAFLAACRYEAGCAGVLDYILENYDFAFEKNSKAKSDLKEFFAKRWQYNFMDGAS